MPCWYYDRKELRHAPSVAQGISQEDETHYRREGARFILQLGNKMGLRYETMATGVVYFHRFYMIHSFQEFPRHVTACCCLFLAGKVEETPKKCKDIMKFARSLVDDATWAEFGGDPREEVMTLERILLQTIKFDFIVEHPYSYLLKYAKCLKGDKKKLQNMVQMAWTFVNDGLCTTLCLQWEPEIIAIALMYLAGKLHKFEVSDWQGKSPKHQMWWDMFVQGISLDLLEDICHQVLDLYSPNKTDNSTALSMAAAVTTPPSAAKTSRQSIETNSSSSKTVEVGSKTQSVTPVGPPPSKKVKKEEAKIVSPAKPEAIPVTQSFQQYPSYPSYPPNYPPPATTPTVSTTPQRYPYPYQTTTPQHPPPPPQQSGQLAHLTPPNAYQAPPLSNRYASSTPTTPTVPPPHYPNQVTPLSHYSTSHPPPYPPLSGSTPQSHYPTPAATQHHTPTAQHHTPTAHHAPYPHYSTPSSYYQPPPPPPANAASNIQTTYQQPPSNSFVTATTNYAHTSRPYYPPAT